ncbi:MAG TPA: response regulator [Thermoanaerobaculia bacterium]|nr:response regulator [Thermoanaerobaculia bacterium]
MRILLVDDDAPSAEALREILESEGHAVIAAENGQVALDALREADRVDVILLDIMMPVMNGYEFREEQLRDPKLASIPVIVLSADGRTREKAARLSAEHIFQKPLSAPDLLRVIREYR